MRMFVSVDRCPRHRDARLIALAAEMILNPELSPRDLGDLYSDPDHQEENEDLVVSTTTGESGMAGSVLDELMADGLVMMDGDRYVLTDAGRDEADELLAGKGGAQ
jgi:hypothetical protein